MEEGTDNYDEAVQKIWGKHSETYIKWVRFRGRGRGGGGVRGTLGVGIRARVRVIGSEGEAFKDLDQEGLATTLHPLSGHFTRSPLRTRHTLSGHFTRSQDTHTLLHVDTTILAKKRVPLDSTICDLHYIFTPRWVKRLGLDAISEWPPDPEGPPATWVTKAYRMLVSARTKTGPSNMKPNTPSSSTQDVDVTLTPSLAPNEQDSKILFSPSLAKEFSLGGDSTVSNKSTTAGSSTASNGSESLTVPLLTGVAELLVAMPALIARQDPTKEPSGSDNARDAIAEVYAAACKAVPATSYPNPRPRPRPNPGIRPPSTRVALPTSYLLLPTSPQVRPQVQGGPRQSFLLAAPV